MTAPRVRVTCEAIDRRFAALVPGVRRAVARALSAATRSSACVAVFLISDAQMRVLNRRYRGKDRPTNVLSFGEPAPPAGAPRPDLPRGMAARGEIYLAPSFIRRRGERIDALAIHGLLHLFGYTHGRARDRMNMEREERRLLKLTER